MNMFTRAWQAMRRGPDKAPQVRKFQAARIDRLASDWFATQQSINEELRSDLDLLRRRGRDLVNNNDYARKFRTMVQDNIVGPSGVRLQSRVEDRPGIPDRLACDAIEAAWEAWQHEADAQGRQHFRDLCATLVGGLPSDGEFLVAIVRGAQAGNRWNFALQAIDVDRIDTAYNGRWGNNNVIMGVEVNEFRRPVALHVFTAHPNDGVHTSRQRMRLAMEDVIHAFKVERPEQLRGIPWMAPGMLSLHHLGNFKLAALLAAEHGANHYGFFTTPDGQAPIGGLGADGETVTVSQPGTFDTLPQGVSFQAYDSKYPEANFGPFVKTTLQRIASGWGVAYHSLANDLEGVSFSSIRSGTLEERDRWMADQEWFINALLEPVFLRWLEWGLLMGTITMPNGSALPASKRDKFVRHEWQARRWDWVDPKADTEANILKVKAGLMSPQDLSAAMGYDFEDTLKAIKAAQDLAAEYGVALTAYDGLPGANSSQAPAPAPEQDAADRRLNEQLRELRELITSRQAPPAQPMQVNVGVSTDQVAQMGREMRDTAERVMNQIREDVQNMPIVIPAPSVTVVNEVKTPEPVANFEAILQVAPAAVTVIDNHPTRAVQTVERDRDDEIVRTVTVYEKD